MRATPLDAPLLQVHERTLQGDFLMALLRGLVPRRRAAGNPLKVRSALVMFNPEAICLVDRLYRGPLPCMSGLL